MSDLDLDLDLKPKPPSEAKKPEGYFEQSADLLNSLILVVPLLLIYELGLLLTGGETLNGVDFITVFLARHWGLQGILVFNGVLVGAGLAGVWVLKNERGFNPKIVIPVILESTVYALFLGTAILVVMSRIPGLAAGGAGYNVVERVFLSIGAGVNEELVFRLGLFTALAWSLGKFTGKGTAVALAVVITSVLFSLVHYVGPTESFELHSFVFRFLAGAIFCGIFMTRGFAVAVYTHAIYDIYVMVILQ